MRPNSDHPVGRRHFLLATAAVAATGGGVGANDPAKVMLRPSGENDLFRIRIEMDAKGNVHVPDNPLVSRKSRLKLPIESEAVFDYEERLRRATGSAAITASERYYHEAKSSGTLNRSQLTSELRQSVRETIVRRDSLPEVIYAVDDYFHQQELELLRVPTSSVAIDRLLPHQPVKVGNTYQPAEDVLTSVLNLASVEASDVQAEVVSIGQTEARFQFQGKVDGSVDGVPTVIRLIGKLTFDRVLGTSTWLAMAIHETREIGKAEPGFDVQATIKMLRKPLAKPIALPAQPRSLAITAPIPQDRLYVELASKQVGFSALMSRKWRVMKDVPGAAMMRMIDNDRSIAQCDVRPLASLSPGNQWTLEAFQQDVRQTLGQQLSELVEADQRVADSGLRVLRITAAGAVEGVPIQWVLMHFSDDTGRRLLATFTMEGENIAEFAGSDLQLASSLRLIDWPDAAAATLQSTTSLDGEGPQARTARANRDRQSGAAAEIEVQSASDLR